MSLRFTTANIDFGLGHDADYLAHLCADADVLLVQEAKTVTLADALPDGWTALQDTRDEGRMGSAICYRNATVEAGPLRLRLGILPRLGRRRFKMLPRYIASAHLMEREGHAWYYATSAHLAPARYRLLQPLMVRRLRRLARRHPFMVLGTDANQPLWRLAKTLRLDHYGAGIVGIIPGRGVAVSWNEVDHWGEQHKLTDHPSVTVTAHHRKARP
jgi:hypothetical protein